MGNGAGKIWSSSVSMVSDYGLDDLAIEVRSLAEPKRIFPVASVLTSSGAHPASYPVGTGVLSLG
jgi:hypothetical protein